nr:integrase, catalytic core [Tanacetum cinerariifolium]
MIRDCNVCQRQKPDLSAYPGLIQPLLIPKRIWKEISIDFIEKLPTSHGKSLILVVVDRLSKYAHFIPLTHPFTASQVAQVFLDQVDIKVEEVDRTLQAREEAIKALKFHLKRSQDRMRNQANKHKTDRQFKVGDWVYLKLQPHRLELPSLSQIHPVFHISQLKKYHGKDHSVGVLPQLKEDGLLENKPMAILERRAISSARDNDGACLQMRLSFSPAVDLFSFLFPWTDCRIAGGLCLLRIFIYMVYLKLLFCHCIKFVQFWLDFEFAKNCWTKDIC